MGDDDLLAKYRRGGEQGGSMADDLFPRSRKPLGNSDLADDEERFPPDDGSYKAYFTHGKAKRLWVRRKGKPSRNPSYANLMDIMFDEETYNEIALVFTYATVYVTGEHLEELAEKLMMERVRYIREFDPKRFERPAKGTAIITSITFESRIPDNTKPEA
jgi:hypothetical protein